YIGYFGTCKAGCHLRENFRFDCFIDFDMLEMNPKNLLPSVEIRSINPDLPVKSSRSQQCIVQYIGPVGGCHQNHSFITGETIHFHKKLVEGVFSFIIPSLDAVASSCTTDGIYFINKDDAGGFFSRLSEQISHP